MTFSEAADRYLSERSSMKSYDTSVARLATVIPYIGSLDISNVHVGTLDTFIQDRLKSVSPNTVHRDLNPVRAILRMAASEWIGTNGKPLLSGVPILKVPGYSDCTNKGTALTMDEQRRIFALLPPILARAALFSVNTGIRKGELIKLRWGWKVHSEPAFIIPCTDHKNGQDRIVVLNSIADNIVHYQEGQDRELVFPVSKDEIDYAWKRAKQKSGLEFRWHDLKHTYVSRLRAAGVQLMDIKDLAGHKNGDVTRRYAAPDIARLLVESERVVDIKTEPTLRLVGN